MKAIKPRKRYQNEAEIVVAIDRLQGLLDRRRKKADELDTFADGVFRIYKPGPDADKKYGKALEARRQAEKYRRMGGASLERLRKMKEALAEIRTMKLPGVEIDGSVLL